MGLFDKKDRRTDQSFIDSNFIRQAERDHHYQSEVLNRLDLAQPAVSQWIRENFSQQVKSYTLIAERLRSIKEGWAAEHRQEIKENPQAWIQALKSDGWKKYVPEHESQK